MKNAALFGKAKNDLSPHDFQTYTAAYNKPGSG